MSDRVVPETANRQDWPRLVAQTVNANARKLQLSSLKDFADDSAAATGGIAVGGLYRNGSQLMIRVS